MACVLLALLSGTLLACAFYSFLLCDGSARCRGCAPCRSGQVACVAAGLMLRSHRVRSWTPWKVSRPLHGPACCCSVGVASIYTVLTVRVPTVSLAMGAITAGPDLDFMSSNSGRSVDGRHAPCSDRTTQTHAPRTSRAKPDPWLVTLRPLVVLLAAWVHDGVRDAPGCSYRDGNSTKLE